MSQNQILWKLLLFFENYITSEGAISKNVLYYQPLPITRYQVRLYANNYFEYQLPIVSTAFKENCKSIVVEIQHFLKKNWLPKQTYVDVGMQNKKVNFRT